MRIERNRIRIIDGRLRLDCCCEDEPPPPPPDVPKFYCCQIQTTIGGTGPKGVAWLADTRLPPLCFMQLVGVTGSGAPLPPGVTQPNNTTCCLSVNALWELIKTGGAVSAGLGECLWTYSALPSGDSTGTTPAIGEMDLPLCDGRQRFGTIVVGVFYAMAAFARLTFVLPGGTVLPQPVILLQVFLASYTQNFGSPISELHSVNAFYKSGPLSESSEPDDLPCAPDDPDGDPGDPDVTVIDSSGCCGPSRDDAMTWWHFPIGSHTLTKFTELTGSSGIKPCNLPQQVAITFEVQEEPPPP